MEPTGTSTCETCHVGADLWVCLICGHVGCGRYRAGHAVAHHAASGHCFALEVETGRVWDYVGDGYVHRLVQQMADGKLVEVADPTNTWGNAGGARELQPGGAGDLGEEYGKYEKDKEDAMLASKLDAVTAEYNHLLVS